MIVALVSTLSAAFAGSAAAQDEIKLTMTCRCVADGVNAQLVEWLLDTVIPTFEEAMAAEGKNVTVELVQFGGSDEQLKEQYALDLGVGGGYDLFSFDGFWVPEFVDAGLLKPLGEVVPAADEWDGWAHVSEGIQAILGYQGVRYGIASGTDVREIF